MCEHKGDTIYEEIRKDLDISTCENDPTVPDRITHSREKRSQIYYHWEDLLIVSVIVLHI
jgi:hypothetical protein